MKIKLLLICPSENPPRYCAIRDHLYRVITFWNKSSYEKESYEEKINKILQQQKITKSDVELLTCYLVEAANIIADCRIFKTAEGIYYQQERLRFELAFALNDTAYKDLQDMFDMMCYLINRLMGFDGTSEELMKIFAPLEVDKHGERTNPILLEQVKREINVMLDNPSSAKLFTWEYIRTLASNKYSTTKLKVFSSIIAQGVRGGNGCYFFKLPDEINTRIATYAAGADPDDRHTLQTACSFFGRPQIEPLPTSTTKCHIM